MITVEKDYKYGLLDAWRERKQTEADADLLKAQALLGIANKPANETNKLLIILPIAVVLIGGIVAIILIKKKRSK